MTYDLISDYNAALDALPEAQEEKQKELLVECDRVESEKIGQGKHEEFHQLLAHLAETYL